MQGAIQVLGFLPLACLQSECSSSLSLAEYKSCHHNLCISTADELILIADSIMVKILKKIFKKTESSGLNIWQWSRLLHYYGILCL